MRSLAVALVMSAMLTVDQHDRYRSGLDNPSASVSADGRYIAFVTYAQLAGADTDGTSDVYVLDRIRQQVTFESTGIPGPTECLHPGISGDGRYVVYEADGAIVWRDRTEDVTRIAGKGRQPSISEDGRVIVFTSDRDVYSLDRLSGETRRVSLDVTALDRTLVSSVSPSASADGRYVSFAARAPFAGPRLPASEVFVRDTRVNATRRIGKGWAPSMSGDGRYVAFVGEMNGLNHVFLADLHNRATRIITKSVRRGRANGSSANPGVSSDGRFVVFQSEASDLVEEEDINLLWDVYLFDRASDTIVRISGDADSVWMEPSIGPSVDRSGSVIAFSSRHPTGAADKRNDYDLYVATIAHSYRRLGD
ncbi:MAG: hypothetical protein EHM55_11455 [Acidobacteria bacterium]|nr:MAG: hypothetical protein EHM55_11455 [Acidobacteriota bacterium]